MIIIPCSHSLMHDLYYEYYMPMSLGILFYDWMYKEYKCEYNKTEYNIRRDTGWALKFEDEADAIIFKLKFGL